MDGVENIRELRRAPGKERTNVHLTDAQCFQQLAESYDSLCPLALLMGDIARQLKII